MKEENICVNCGENIDKGGHFAPPSFGEEGFFICKELKKNKREKDLCVLCSKETPYNKDMHIDLRENYVDGGGQLCDKCANKIYKGE